MFLVVDLSAPRKYMIRKYDDAMLDYKLNPPKINKPLVTAALIGIIIIAAGTVVHASVAISPEQFDYLVNHYVNHLHYPKDMAEGILESINNEELSDLYSRVQAVEAFKNKPHWFIKFSGKMTVKFIGWAKMILSQY